MFIYGQPDILTPPASPGLGAVTYTDAEVAQTLRESSAEGFSLVEAISDVIAQGVPIDQAYRAADIVAAETSPVEKLRSIFDTSIFTKTAEEKAAYYNNLLDSGFSDATIRAALNAPEDENWQALRSLAARLRNNDADAAAQAARDASAKAAAEAAAAQAAAQAAAAAAAAQAARDAAAAATANTTVVAAQTYTDAQVAQALRESIAQGFSLLDSIAGVIRVFGVPVDQAYRAGDIVANEMEAARREAVAKAAADAAAAQAARDASAKAAAEAAAAQAAAQAAAAAAAAKAARDAAAAQAARDAAAKAAADAAAKAALTVKPATRTFTDAEIAQAMRESLRQGFSLRDAVTGAVMKFAVPQDQATRVAQQIAAETQPTPATPGQPGIGPLLLAVAAAIALGG